MPQAGQAERFALVCPAVDVVGSVRRCAWPVIVPAGHSLHTLNVPWGRRAGSGPGLGGAFQSALASFDHFSQGKSIKNPGPYPSFVYKMTNSRIGGRLDLPA